MSRLAGLVVLAGVFLLGAGTVVFLSFRGTQVKVPNLVGKQEGEAERLLSDAGLRFKIRNRATDEKTPANLVSDQLPESGSIVKAGQVVGVTISTGIEAKKPEEAAIVKPVVAPKPKASATPKPEKAPDETAEKPGETAEGAAPAKVPGEKTDEPVKGEKQTPASTAPKASGAGDKPAPETGDGVARPAPAKTTVRKPSAAGTSKPPLKTPVKPVIN